MTITAIGFDEFREACEAASMQALSASDKEIASYARIAALCEPTIQFQVLGGISLTAIMMGFAWAGYVLGRRHAEIEALEAMATL